MEVDTSVPPPGAAPTPAAAGAAGPVVATTPSGAPASDSGASGGGNGLRIGSYVGFGVGAVGVVLGTVFVLKSSSKRAAGDKAADALQAKCGNACDDTTPEAQNVHTLYSDARSAKTLGIVGYVVGGLGAAAGVTLFVLSNKHQEPQSSAFVAPYVGLGALGVRGAF
jgi:hypothetical protein